MVLLGGGEREAPTKMETKLNQIFPYVYIDESSLGGSTSTFIKISLDPKEDWNNKIYHNSRYAIFCVSGGKLELISKYFEMPKFRKSVVKSDDDIVAKLIKYSTIATTV